MEQYTLDFKATNNYPSQCDIIIYRQSGIVIATDIDKGMSRSADAVTNACELIANEVVRQFHVNPHRMIFIERYRPGRPDQTTDLVRFVFVEGERRLTSRFRNLSWTHLPVEEFNRMIAIAHEVEVM